MENYESLGVIGEGTYGVVMKARHRETGQIVAIKKFKESDEDEQVRKTSLREVRVLKQLRHDNVITLLEVFRRKGKLHLVFEYVDRTILEVLEKKPNGLDESEVRRFMYQLLRGVEYCHAHNIIHRDIKPENILISKNGVLKLCDFGFARTMSIGGKYTDYVATRWYRAPELLVGDVEYGKGVDIWAVGCIFAEISNGMPLFPGESDLDQLAHIMRCFGKITNRMVQIFRRNPLYAAVELPPANVVESLDDRFPSVPKNWITFLKSCLRNDPDQRESCSTLMSLPYFVDKNFRNEYENELKLVFEKENRQNGGVRKASEGSSSAPQSQLPLPQGGHMAPPTPTQYSGDQYAPALPLSRKSDVNTTSGIPGTNSPVPSHPALGSLWSQYLASATTELPDLTAGQPLHGKPQPLAGYMPHQGNFFPSTMKPPSQGGQGRFPGDMVVTNGRLGGGGGMAGMTSMQQQHVTQAKKAPSLFPTLLSTGGPAGSQPQQQPPSTPQQTFYSTLSSQTNTGTTGGSGPKGDPITSQLQYKKKPQKKHVLSTLNLNSTFGSNGGGSNSNGFDGTNGGSGGGGSMMLFGHGSGSGGGDPSRRTSNGKQW